MICSPVTGLVLAGVLQVLMANTAAAAMLVHGVRKVASHSCEFTRTQTNKHEKIN